MRESAIILLVLLMAACTMTTAGHPAACKKDSTQRAAIAGSFSIGFRYPPMPAGVEDLGGFLVMPKNGHETELAIAIVRDKKGIVIWLDQIIYRNGCPNPDYVILDYRRVPPLANNEKLSHNCRAGDVSDGGDGLTIAVARDQNSEVHRNIRLSWRVDVEARRLVEISPAGIQCINDGFLERE